MTKEDFRTKLSAIKYRDDLLDRWSAAKESGVILEISERIREVQRLIDEEWR